MLPAAQMPKDLRVRTGVNYDFLENALDALANPLRLRILAYLTRPHYLEEIAKELAISRQATKKHLDRLVEAGLLENRSGMRDSGPVSEYVLNPAALFLVHDEFEKLGRLRRQEPGPPEQTRPSLDPGNGAPLSTGPSLQVVRGIPTGARHPLGHGPTRTWTIGRDPSCEVVVGHDPYASKRHAEVRWATSGFVLVDLGSTNSTHHNWQALPKGGQVALRHGDIVGVGKTLLVFWEAPGNRRS